MRKLLTASLLILAISTNAFAAPSNDSSERNRGPVDRIIRVIKRVIGVIHPLDDIGPIQPPIPTL